MNLRKVMELEPVSLTAIEMLMLERIGIKSVEDISILEDTGSGKHYISFTGEVDYQSIKQRVNRG